MLLYPPVSAICPTYGRPHLLEEAIYSFLNQDYPGTKELVVLNDFDQQTLVFDHPEVSIINTAERYPSLGEKRNAAIALARHDILMVWDDDDICLPHRISISVDRLRDSCGYFKQGSKTAIMNHGIIDGILDSSFHCSSAFTRELFTRVGGYQMLHRGEDVAFERAVFDLIGMENIVTLHAASEHYYIYRWGGTGSYHASWYENTEEASGNQRVASHVRQALMEAQIPQGIVELRPHWAVDYTTLYRSIAPTLFV